MNYLHALKRLAFVSLAALAVTVAPASALAAKVEICHKGKKTIHVHERALAAHRAHGDYLGGCDEIHAAKLIVSCAISELAPATHEVIATSATEDLTADIDLTALADSNCATAQQMVQAANCKVDQVFGTPEAQTYSLSCPTEDAMLRGEDDD